MKHKVQFGKGLVNIERHEYEAGEEVTFLVPFLTDCDATATSDDVEIHMGTIEGTYAEYKFIFIMPDHDVYISINYRNTMMNMNYMRDFANPSDPVPSRFMGMTPNFEHLKGTPLGDKNPAKFCHECGTPLVPDKPFFCPECGAKQ